MSVPVQLTEGTWRYCIWLVWNPASALRWCTQPPECNYMPPIYLCINSACAHEQPSMLQQDHC